MQMNLRGQFSDTTSYRKIDGRDCLFNKPNYDLLSPNSGAKNQTERVMRNVQVIEAVRKLMKHIPGPSE